MDDPKPASPDRSDLPPEPWELEDDPFGPSRTGSPGGTSPPPIPNRPAGREGDSRRTAVIVAVVAILLAGALAWWFWPDGEESPVTESVATEPEVPPAVEAEPEPPPLPSVDESDPLLRSLLSALTTHPDALAWLLTDDLARRIAVAVDNVADGVSPRRTLRGLGPSDGFEVATSGDRTHVAPASFRRYDSVAESIATADVPGLARVIAEVSPILDEAYSELGRADRNFDEALKAALRRLAAVPVPEEPILLRARTLRYVYVDAGLEALDPASKHLLRFGPENQRRVQATLGRLLSRLESD